MCIESQGGNGPQRKAKFCTRVKIADHAKPLKTLALSTGSANKRKKDYFLGKKISASMHLMEPPPMFLASVMGD